MRPLGGLGAGVVTAGLAPLIETAFGFTTDIKLLELANLDQPILRKLMINAPGTYHHSVIVGSMVEAAAAEIGANSLLAKVCGYYHDIGKLKKPLYFVENQAEPAKQARQAGAFHVAQHSDRPCQRRGQDRPGTKTRAR